MPNYQVSHDGICQLVIDAGNPESARREYAEICGLVGDDGVVIEVREANQPAICKSVGREEVVSQVS